MTDDEERSAEARALAERALTQLLAGGAPTSELLIVLGGLVPPTLTSDLPDVPAHLGTTDVDVLLVTQLTAGRDLGPIERALEAMDFAPRVTGGAGADESTIASSRSSSSATSTTSPARRSSRHPGAANCAPSTFAGRATSSTTTADHARRPRRPGPGPHRRARRLPAPRCPAWSPEVDGRHSPC